MANRSIPRPQPPFQPFRIADGHFTIIDQTLLPNEERWIDLETVQDFWEAIKMLRIRGAPAIGVTAAYGLVATVRNSDALDPAELLKDLATARDYLKTSRPTAVNLAWAVDRIFKRIQGSQFKSVQQMRQAVEGEAAAILAEDLDVGRKIGELGAALLESGTVLTHCNAGGLATSGYGTALSPIYVAHEQGKDLHVFVDETRPLLQGSRLTSWELARAGISATLIADNMAATVMARGEVGAVIVGADRVAANGDVANKIGTLGVALAARAFQIPFYVAMPTSTIDFATLTGAEIPIEERDASELSSFNGRPISPAGINIYNPAFDITGHDLVTAFITEHGVIKPPFEANLRMLEVEHAPD